MKYDLRVGLAGQYQFHVNTAPGGIDQRLEQLAIGNEVGIGQVDLRSALPMAEISVR
jgi:hypothetical protein